MKLYRYYPYCVKKLRFSKLSYFVRFNGARVASKKNVLFVSSQKFQSSSVASQFLSLTYKPRHVYSFDSDPHFLKDNEGNDVDISTNTILTRAWPAFGKCGGGAEAILECDSKNEISALTDDLYIDGGSFDRFHLDAILPLTFSTLKMVADGTAQVFDNVKEAALGSVKEGSLVFKWQQNQRFFTISVGIKETPDGMILHLWGAEWRDNGSWRIIICALEDELQTVNIGKEELQGEFDSSKGSHFDEFSIKVRMMADALSKSKQCDDFHRCFPTPFHRFIRLP
ncbi:MAG: hypothetical protein ACYDAO_10270 [Thermoplasmataceae archaeon]